MISKYDKNWLPANMSYTQQIKKGHLQEGKKIDFTNDVPEAIDLDYKTTIYLAHPYDRRNSKRKEDIIRKLEARRFIVIDPFIGEDKLAEKYGVNYFYENPCRDFAREIKTRDLIQVALCDCLFAWIPKGVTTIGTIREFDSALAQGKYTIILCYKANPWLEDANELYLSYQDFLEDKQFIWK